MDPEWEDILAGVIKNGLVGGRKPTPPIDLSLEDVGGPMAAPKGAALSLEDVGGPMGPEAAPAPMDKIFNEMDVFGPNGTQLSLEDVGGAIESPKGTALSLEDVGGAVTAGAPSPLDGVLSEFDVFDDPKGNAKGKPPTPPAAPAAPTTPPVDPNDPYAGVRSKGYGQETTGDMLSLDAPIYTPKGPPDLKDGKKTFSDEKGNLFGVDPRLRDVNSEVQRLMELRSTMEKPTGKTGIGTNEQDFRDIMQADEDKARTAYFWISLSDGNEAAERFRQNHLQRKQDYIKGLNEARDRDAATAGSGDLISDANAQMLVRAYGITPEAAATMTNAEYKRLEPVLKSTPYVMNQVSAREAKTADEERKYIQKAAADMGDDATKFGVAMLKGRKKGKYDSAGGGMGAVRDIVPTLTALSNVAPDEAAEAARKLEAGEPPSSPQEAELMNTAKLIRDAPGKVFDAMQKSAASSGVLGRTNKTYAVEEGIRAKKADPNTKYKIASSWTSEMKNLRRAMRAFRNLKERGKINLLVQTPFGSWAKFINTQLSGEDQDDARKISAYINPKMRQQTGAALSEFEKDMSFNQFGITGAFNPKASPDALEGWLGDARQDMLNVHRIIKETYGFDPAGKKEGAE